MYVTGLITKWSTVRTSGESRLTARRLHRELLALKGALGAAGGQGALGQREGRPQLHSRAQLHHRVEDLRVRNLEYNCQYYLIAVAVFTLKTYYVGFIFSMVILHINELTYAELQAM